MQCEGTLSPYEANFVMSTLPFHCHCLLLVNTRENDKKTILKKRSIHCEHSDFIEMASCKIKSSAITESAKKHLVT